MPDRNAKRHPAGFAEREAKVFRGEDSPGQNWPEIVSRGSPAAARGFGVRGLDRLNPLKNMVPRAGIEPATRGFSGRVSRFF